MSSTTPIQALSLCGSAIFFITALVLVYPLQLILVHTLIESPFGAGNLQNSRAYAPAPKDDFDIPEALDDAAEETVGGATHQILDEAPAQLAISSMQTRSVFTAWSNLKSAGTFGLFRALPVQIVYAVIFESLFALFGGLHPVMQLLSRIQSEDPSRVKFTWSPLLMLTMVGVKVLLIPLHLVVLRQIIGKPDSVTWIGHLKALISQVGVRPMSAIILPQILKTAIPLLLQNLTTFLHFLYLKETVVEPGWYAFFAILELLWQLFSVIFIVAPLDAVLYRAQASVLTHMPKFDGYIAFPTSYISPLAELKQIVEEEMHISGTWYGRYLRSFKVIATTSIVLFVLLVLGIIPPLVTGAIKLQQ